ncbi:MAG: hypothetical protein Q7K26_06855 [bacterium]|nr:hypothetical protein [bacterium]
MNMLKALATDLGFITARCALATMSKLEKRILIMPQKEKLAAQLGIYNLVAHTAVRIAVLTTLGFFVLWIQVMVLAQLKL